jgi:hypothetical protein
MAAGAHGEEFPDRISQVYHSHCVRVEKHTLKNALDQQLQAVAVINQ